MCGEFNLLAVLALSGNLIKIFTSISVHCETKFKKSTIVLHMIGLLVAIFAEFMVESDFVAGFVVHVHCYMRNK